MKLTKEQITFALPTMDVRNTVLADRCPLEVDFPCQPRKYRAYNGYCNNVQNPRWGNANTRYLRFLPPDYSDGIKTHYWRMESMEILNNCCVSVSAGVSIPRQATDGTFLPSARDISLAVHKDVDNPHLHLTAMAAIWGQLVHNDISHTPQMAGELVFHSFSLHFLSVLLVNRQTTLPPLLYTKANFLFKELASIATRQSIF